jgi:hypothetical protein
MHETPKGGGSSGTLVQRSEDRRERKEGEKGRHRKLGRDFWRNMDRKAWQQ